MKRKKKNQFLVVLLCHFVSIAAIAQTDPGFNEPWKSPDTAIVIDAFYNNSINWGEMRNDTRVAGIIHKATEGDDFIDPAYSTRRKTAKTRGYKWGSYHLLKKGDPIKQANFYLATIGNSSGEIMALDVECTVNSKCEVEKYRVSTPEIKAFLKVIKEKTGRYPIFYANHSVVSDLSKNHPNEEILTKTPLWYARFKSRVTDFSTGIWKTYKLWQFSSELNCTEDEQCLYRVRGTLSDMDINVYNGTVEELKAEWASIGKQDEK